MREVHAGTWSSAKLEQLLACAKRLGIDTAWMRDGLKAQCVTQAKKRGKSPSPDPPHTKISKAGKTQPRGKTTQGQDRLPA